MDNPTSDSIHPPGLIHLDMNRHLDNASSALPPDSPLSTPPDTPRRPRPDNDVDNGLKGSRKSEEEKKEDGDDGPRLEPHGEEGESVPDDEKDMIIDVERNSSEGIASANGAEKPFDEKTPKKTEEEEKPDDEKSMSSAPEDEKLTHMTEVDGAGAANKERGDEELIEEPPSLVSNMQSIPGVGIQKVVDDIDEPPSLSLEVKETCNEVSSSAKEADDMIDTDPMITDEMADISDHPAYKKGEEELETASTAISGNETVEKSEETDASLGVETKPLSRLEEAMKRTSLMVLKHSQRKERTIPSTLPEEERVAPSVGATKATTMVPNSTAHSKSDSNRLVSLQKDVMSLKTSLSDMDTKLHDENSEDQKSTGHVEVTKVDDGCDKHNIPHLGDVDEVSPSKAIDTANNITVETTELSFSQEEKSNTISVAAPTAEYPEMTPKKDLQGSDKSAGWLQEELRRRAVVKREINDAIEARGQGEGEKTAEPIDELPSISSPQDMRDSQSTMEDEEVAAITANGERTKNEQLRMESEENPPPLTIGSPMGGPIPRRLDFHNEDEQPDDEYRETNAGDELMGFQPVFDYQDIQDEMKKFASETRAALREQSFTDIVRDPYSSAVPVAFSSPMSNNASIQDFNPDFQTDAITNSANAKRVDKIQIKFSDLEAGDAPTMLRTMDSFDGIASGDIFISLLSENAGRSEGSEAATWANRVHGAIWRARKMRRSIFPAPSNGHDAHPLIRGLNTVADVQKAAIIHLKRDEIDEAINLVEGITFAYYSYFERSLNSREKNPESSEGIDSEDFMPYIGMALHNLGILHLLNGRYEEALSYFVRAVENRKKNLEPDHPHYITSLVRLSICRYALNDFAEAHSGLEEALECAKRRRSATLEDRLQMAEILNNLGCLAYMSGQPASASSYYRDSMDIQFGALSDSLYLGNATSGQSISLNISIARANIGFIKLVTKDLPIAITALENALMEQQILLKGTNETLLATMDHLALSNLLSGSQDKSALMYNRILTLQQQEYGPQDMRCFVTVDKIKMVQGKGVEYKNAIEQLRKTFSMPSKSNSSVESLKNPRSPNRIKGNQAPKSTGKKKKNKVLKALSSLKKKNP